MDSTNNAPVGGRLHEVTVVAKTMYLAPVYRDSAGAILCKGEDE